MSTFLGLKFSDYGQIYYFDSGPFVVAKDDRVIVQTEQGMGLGTVVTFSEEQPEGIELADIKSIYRLALPEDLEVEQNNAAFAKEAYTFCQRCIRVRELEMKLVDVEVFFDRGKIIFFFTAPGRIDFRELVKDLVKNYRTRIELRQIGVRHETQMIGAVGNCGQVVCCRRFLRKFDPVTIKMAKEQNLFLNPTKISGICGRLLCCLSFEEENYQAFYKRCPKIGKRMETDKGLVKVLRANFFRSSITVLTEHNEEEEITLDEWEEINPRRFDPNVAKSPAAQQPKGTSAGATPPSEGEIKKDKPVSQGKEKKGLEEPSQDSSEESGAKSKPKRKPRRRKRKRKPKDESVAE